MKTFANGMPVSLASIAVGVLVVVVVILLVRFAQRRQDDARRKTERAAYEERLRAERAERADAAVMQLAERFFPFVVPALESSTMQDGDAKARLRDALACTPGIELGRASIGLPAALPLSERRKHLIGLGKSGYGKTSIALRLIGDDLQADRGVCVLGSEAELFRDWLLPLVPSRRAAQAIHFRPADPRCPLTWNSLTLEEGDDRALAAGELFAIFKRTVGEESIGARADAILSCGFPLLVGRRGATLWTLLRLLEDEAFRAAVVEESDDPYLRDFWTKTFPEYPSGAILPLANRMNQFLRLPQLRAALCHPVSSFSIREALAASRILFFDVSGLDPDATKLLGQMLLSKFQLELMRRERCREEERSPVHVYVDEFHVFADSSEGTWRELLARGRRYGLGLHLFTQHPNQLPRSLQHEIFGNVSSVICLNLSAGDAATVRRELLVPSSDGVLKPISAEELVSLPVGEGYARLGSGACALKVKFAEPIPRPDVRLGEHIRDISWKTYAAPPLTTVAELATSEPRSGADATHDGANSGPTPGRGGQQHKILQALARRWAEERGFRTTIEQEVLGGAGRVDVALIRGDVRIAVEVRVTATAHEIAAALTKSFAAGFTMAIVLSVDNSNQDKILEQLDAKDRSRVRFLDPESFQKYLDELPAPTATEYSPAGYRLKVEADQIPRIGLRARRRTLAQIVGTALLRRRGMS